MSTAAPGVDTREMIAVHSAFRREFGLAPGLVRGVAPGDVQRAGVVADHLELIGSFLHHHHAGEDKLLWPKLLERVPAELAPTVELMERQHEGVHEVIEEMNAALGRWRAGAAETETSWPARSTGCTRCSWSTSPPRSSTSCRWPPAP
jgi:hypothetical protein